MYCTRVANCVYMIPWYYNTYNTFLRISSILFTMRKYTLIFVTFHVFLKIQNVGYTGYCLYCLHKNNEPDRHIFNTDGCIARTPYLQPLHFPIYLVVRTKLQMGFFMFRYEMSIKWRLQNKKPLSADFSKLLRDNKLQENLLLTWQDCILTKSFSNRGFKKKSFIYQIVHFVGN